MNHDSRFFTLLSFILLFTLAACQTSASPSPTVTSLPPTETPLPTETAAPTPSLATTVDSCEPGQNIFSPLNATDYFGEIDGARFYNEAKKLKGAEVEVSGIVVESQHFILSGGVDGTLVLVNISGADGKLYPGMVLLPDKGAAVNQYLPDTHIHAVGIHLGYIEGPPNLFKVLPKVDEVPMPSMSVELASGGCK